MKDTVIIYHSPCLDGFGGAYAAWKKFGDSATYLPMRRSALQTEGLAGKDVYFIDFTYPKELTEKIAKEARSVTILDHHIGVKDVVESVPTHVFDNDRSGATIAWKYFHPDKPLPRLFSYLEDIDLFRRALPSHKEIALYVSAQPFDFAVWDDLAARFEHEEEFEQIKKIGLHYGEYHDQVVNACAQEASLVEFEGYAIRAANVPNFFASSVAHRLYEAHPPFALTWHTDSKVVRYSLRGNGEVNLAALAKKYGGNGHHDAAGFNLPHDAPRPFKHIRT